MKVILFVIVGFHDVVEDYIILVSFFTFKNSVIKIYFHVPPSPHYTGRFATSLNGIVLLCLSDKISLGSIS